MKDTPLIVDCDAGRDPDDVYAITWFLAQGVDIKLLSISPGDPDQMSFIEWLVKVAGANNTIVAPAKLGRAKASLSHPHLQLAANCGVLLTDYERVYDRAASSYYEEFIKAGANVFVCGPPDATGEHLKTGGPVPAKLVMQGGFCSYEHYEPAQPLAKFAGLSEVPSFNPGGNPKAMQLILESGIKDLSFVGKNVCHSICFTSAEYERMLRRPISGPADRIFRQFAAQAARIPGGKAFHDPLAAALYLYPELGTWLTGTPYRLKGKWGTKPGPDGVAQVLVDVDRAGFWTKMLGVPSPAEASK